MVIICPTLMNNPKSTWQFQPLLCIGVFLNQSIFFPLQISTNQKEAKIKVELHNPVVIKSTENLFFDQLACLIGVSHHNHRIWESNLSKINGNLAIFENLS